jgi:hypothetical protein
MGDLHELRKRLDRRRSDIRPAPVGRKADGSTASMPEQPPFTDPFRYPIGLRERIRRFIQLGEFNDADLAYALQCDDALVSEVRAELERIGPWAVMNPIHWTDAQTTEYEAC